MILFATCIFIYIEFKSLPVWFKISNLFPSGDISSGISTRSFSILTQMQELASDLKEFDAVRAMPGVGDVLAPRLIAEI
jgi:hypothetical protein